MATVPNVLSGIDEVLCPRHFAFFSKQGGPLLLPRESYADMRSTMIIPPLDVQA